MSADGVFHVSMWKVEHTGHQGRCLLFVKLPHVDPAERAPQSQTQIMCGKGFSQDESVRDTLRAGGKCEDFRGLSTILSLPPDISGVLVTCFYLSDLLGFCLLNTDNGNVLWSIVEIK